jgi:hypothetical protein
MNPIIDFLKETWNRLTSKSPLYFRIVQYISTIVAVIMGLPALLVHFQSDLGLTFPQWVGDYSSKLVGIAAAVAWVLAKLPVKDVYKKDLPVTTNTK